MRVLLLRLIRSLGALALCLSLTAGCAREAAPDCEGVSGASVTRIVPRWGSGHEATVRLRFADGVPIVDRDLSACLKLQDKATGSSLDVGVVSRAAEGSYTLLLVDPGRDAKENDVVGNAVRAVLSTRPLTDRIAIYRWGTDVTQVVTFQRDRNFLNERMMAGLTPTTETPGRLDQALGVIAKPLDEVGGVALPVLRTVVVVTPRAIEVPPAAALKGAGPYLLAWLGPEAALASVNALPEGLRFPIKGGQAMTAAALLSERLDAYAASAHYTVGSCSDGKAHSTEVVVVPTDARVALAIPATLPENMEGRCRPDWVATLPRDFPQRIDLLFTPAQKEVAEAAYMANLGDKFPLSIRLGPDRKPATAEAHFRGEGSYRCKRRNYSINLDGKTPRFLFPGSSANKFHLIAMCLDRLYMRNFTALTMMSEEGLFPVPLSLIEVRINGVSEGIYLLTESVPDSVRGHFSGVTSVVRRQDDNAANKTFPEVRWTATDDATSAASYNGIMDGLETLAGNELNTRLRSRLNLDQYLTLLAFLNVIGSGDYVDEVYFYGSTSTSPDGTPVEHFGVMGWDQDDMFTACHFSGRGTVYDQPGLLACAESELVKRVFTDPMLYRRYVDVMAGLLQRMTPARFEKTVSHTAARLLTFFRDPQILAAMTEMQALNGGIPVTYDVATQMFQSDVNLMIGEFEANRTRLMNGVVAARATK